MVKWQRLTQILTAFDAIHAFNPRYNHNKVFSQQYAIAPIGQTIRISREICPQARTARRESYFDIKIRYYWEKVRLYIFRKSF